MSEEHPDERSFRRHHYAKTKLLFRGQNYIPLLPPSLIQRSSLVLQAIFDAQQKMASVPLLMCLAFCRFGLEITTWACDRDSCHKPGSCQSLYACYSTFRSRTNRTGCESLA